MRLALLTDIHANREAFEAVLVDLEQRHVDRLVFLGDIVGYGPDPEWCLDTVKTMVASGAVCVRGNHDRAIAVKDTILNSNARRVIDWTVNRLSPLQRQFLQDLPLTVAEDDMQFVHASANDPADWIYVTSAQKAMPSFRVSQARLVFCGHVHRAQLYSCDVVGRVAQFSVMHGHPIPLLTSRRWLAVIGSVGQARDGSAKANYAILDRTTNELTFYKVGYDTATTARKSRERGLPEALAHRLLKGE